MLCFLQFCAPYQKLQAAISKIEMEDQYTGLLKVRVIRGMNLVQKDLIGSDPYVVVRLGDQRVKCRTVKRNLNPFWDDELTLGVPSQTPQLEVEVMDKDRFSSDESLGSVKVDLLPLVRVAEKYSRATSDNGKQETILTLPASQNKGFSSDSCILIENGEIKQQLHLKLENVQTGEVDIDLNWIYI